ncbi:DUF1206 domain-containing protein [Agrococcus carbonis]|uniref:DUF1206 domain-containing protein n=1 Tax=Agrococcus carbonis TaxID=684552 RepID=A0A1H1NSV9_9MICO|nr:DUF1206 domain-containing protein [Agrococcus carbonis]SDS02071.1 protein of unknown function [Agrococcus carbonis]
MVDGERARDAASQAKDAAGRAAGQAQDAAARAERSRTARRVALVGQIANGIVHLIIGGIALAVAFGAGGSADQSGAMRALQQTPVGGVALWAVGIAMLLLAVHSAVSAVAASRRDWKDAVRAGGRAAAYVAVGVTALVFALGGSSDSEESTQSFSATLMASPFGQLLVGAVGVGIAGIGVAFIVKGLRLKFREDVAPPRRFRRAVDVLGASGYVAKGLAVVIVGVLFVIAAVQHDPEEAGGLDGALQSLTSVPGGVIALVAIALGLMLYGLYCFARGAWSR